jgi:signal transduction histidine kinase
MAKGRGIRQRLLTIVLLGAVTSALSLIALVKVLSITTAYRLERGREVLRDELDRALAAPAAEPTGTSLIGVRAGVISDGAPAAPAAWRAAIDRTLVEARSSGRAFREEEQGDSTLLVGARVDGARTAWAGYLVAPPSWLRMWQVVVFGLALATALLVAAVARAVIVLKRSAAALHASLLALGEDLNAPIPRLDLKELSDIADGIGSMARRLAQSRAAEERMARELAQKERLAALGRVAAGVAHEVRNPLASIKLRLDLAAAGAQLPSEVGSALANASSEIARLDRLVADLLVVAGRPLGPRKPTQVAELVRARVELLVPWAASRNVSFAVDGAARAALDPDSIARAVDNLLRNAVEASPAGAAVSVHVDESGGAARVIVEDRGPGVQRTGELFEPFFSTKSDGTGLGLAISRSIARAHGGDVTYTRGDGATRFVLTLAVRAVEPELKEAS